MTALRLACGCSPSHGHSCPACDGTYRDDPPAPPVTEPLPVLVAVPADPWLQPTTALPPF